MESATPRPPAPPSGGIGRHPPGLLLALCAAVSAGLSPTSLDGQEPPADPSPAEVLVPFGTPSPSIGQPLRWQIHAGGGVHFEPGDPGETVGPFLMAAVQRPLFNPVAGAFAFRAEPRIAMRGSRPDAGLAVGLRSDLLMVSAGLDWAIRGNRIDPFLALHAPLRRGGLFGQGDQLQIRYMPGRDHALGISVDVPLRRPAGRTRPRGDPRLRLPPAPRAEPAAFPAPGEDAAEALRRAATAMERIVVTANLFSLMQAPTRRPDEGLEVWDARLRAVRSSMEEWDRELAGGDGHPALVARYHRDLDRAFGLAVGASPEDAEKVGRPLADRARRLVLGEVVLPYNRAIGQFREPDTLAGLAAPVRARWKAWAMLEAERPLGAEKAGRAAAVLDGWLVALEEARRHTARLADDERLRWLPMSLVLRAEDHATQEQVDALIELGLGRGFSEGNAVLPINGAQFQLELERSLLETEAYHVLLIHDYRGRTDEGAMDRVGFRVSTEGYLRALLGAVRAYDRTGRLPVFVLLVDQLFYEENDGRLWLSLLERPLSARVNLPDGEAAAGATIHALQDSLRNAAAQSRRLQAEIAVLGAGWAERTVRVHVSVVYPSDFSFRSIRLLSFPPGGDNLMREHRKLFVRDVFEQDPWRGEVAVTGAGVGEKYASSLWDESALLLQGPAALQAAIEVRHVLTEHGVEADALPREPFGSGRAGTEEGGDGPARPLRSTGRVGDARALQVHNRTGWQRKDASFVLMLLFDLAPAGTVLLVPDSSWTGLPWLSRLMNAALRGCHVLIVGPAEDNDPSVGFPWYALMQEVLARAHLAGDVLGPRIRAAGGDMRVGLFSRGAPLDDVRYTLASLDRALMEHRFLAELLPFPEAPPVGPESDPALPSRTEGRRLPGLTTGTSVAWSGNEAQAVPELHRKTHWVVDRELLAAVAASPAMARLLAEAAQATGSMTHRPETGPLQLQDRMGVTRSLLELRDTAAEGVDRPLAYFSSGSMNMSVRSLALDGDVTVLVAGRWAMQPFFDLLFFVSGVSWVESLEEFQTLYPPLPFVQRRIGWWLQNVL